MQAKCRSTASAQLDTDTFDQLLAAGSVDRRVSGLIDQSQRLLEVMQGLLPCSPVLLVTAEVPVTHTRYP